MPPLSAGCASLPKSREAIAAELAKQDSLLNQIHSEMNHGFTMRSDQLWEVQRFITQLKVDTVDTDCCILIFQLVILNFIV